MRLVPLSLACLVLHASTLHADVTVPPSSELASLRQRILAAANGEAQLPTSTTRGLLDVYDYFDSEEGHDQRSADLLCRQQDIDDLFHMLLGEDFEALRYHVRDYGADALRCRAVGDGALCEGSIGREGGYPSRLELRFRREGQSLILASLVHRGSDQHRYSDAQLRRPHACRGRSLAR